MTLFEKIAAGQLPASMIYQDEHCMAFMDIHPMAKGHVLVCPKQGHAILANLAPAVRQHIWDVANQIALAQQQALGSIAQHFLVNDGPGASQTVPHVHIHVIPRYPRDRIKTVARIIAHIGVLLIPTPISQRKRAELDQLANKIKQAMPLA